MIYWQLFYEFFLISLFAIGGGMAMLPFLFDLAEKYPWFTGAELLDMVAISESTPGPIGINMATYAGFNASGFLGAAVATFALVLPSFIIVQIIGKFLEKFNDNPYVQSSFYGIHPVVTGLIAAAWLQIAQTSLFTAEISLQNLWQSVHIKALFLFLVLLYPVMKFKKHPVVYLCSAAVFGIIFKL